MPPVPPTPTAETIFNFLSEMKTGSYELNVSDIMMAVLATEGASYFQCGNKIITIRKK